MNNILDKLLKGHEFEWQTLGEIAIKISSGGTPNTNNVEYWEDGTVPWMSSGEVNLGIIYETEKFITEAGLKNSSAKFVPKNSIVIALAGQGKTRGKVARIRIDLTTNQSLASLTFDEKIINPDYVYHFLDSQYDNLRQISSGNGNRGGLNLQMISSYKIPIPSLEVQNEIVRILDAFTALTNELTNELKLRQQQYQYYREKLLSFSDVAIETDSNRQQQTALWETITHNVKQNYEIVWKRLDELGQLIRGHGLQKADFTETGFPAIHYGQIYTYFGTFADKTKSFVDNDFAKKLKKAQKGDVLLAGTSENLQDVMKPLGWLGDEIAISGDMFAFRPNKDLDTKYLTYLLQANEFQKYKEKHAHGTKVTRLSSEKFLKFLMPVPSIEEQKRIANILDKFETLTNSITEGLPREIAQRQQQYEYYREQLLDFPQP